VLRSEAVVRGPAMALDRFDSYRRDLRKRLGADPGEPLQRVHRGLLALDRPVRRGVRYDATELIGRDGDLDRLPSLMTSSRVVSIVGAGGWERRGWRTRSPVTRPTPRSISSSWQA